MDPPTCLIGSHSLHILCSFIHPSQPCDYRLPACQPVCLSTHHPVHLNVDIPLSIMLDLYMYTCLSVYSHPFPVVLCVLPACGLSTSLSFLVTKCCAHSPYVIDTWALPCMSTVLMQGALWFTEPCLAIAASRFRGKFESTWNRMYQCQTNPSHPATRTISAITVPWCHCNHVSSSQHRKIQQGTENTLTATNPQNSIGLGQSKILSVPVWPILERK